MSKKIITVGEIRNDIKVLNIIEKKLVEKNDLTKNQSETKVDFVEDLKHLLKEFYVISVLDLVKDDFKELMLFVNGTRENFLNDIERIENDGLIIYRDC